MSGKQEKVDRRIRKTRMQLRQGLARLLQKKSIREITVKELVEEVDINRSTFYLHYCDIFQMLESIEMELFDQITELIQSHHISPFNEQSFPFIEDIFQILYENKEICGALLGPNGDMVFVHRIEDLISQHSLQALKDSFPDNMDELKYSYSFCLSGCVGLVKHWLTTENTSSPQEMAQLTFHLVMHAVDELYPKQ